MNCPYCLSATTKELVLTRFNGDRKNKPGRVGSRKAEPVAPCPTPWFNEPATVWQQHWSERFPSLQGLHQTGSISLIA